MARFSIISKDGTTVRYEGCPKYTGTYLNVPYLDFASIESPYPIDWEVGDFVTYHRTGLTYRLYTIPEPKKQARKGMHGAAFVYTNVKFYSAVKDLEIAQFRDLVPEDNDIHFSTRPEVNTFENVHGIASRIQECMNDLFPGKWEIRVYNTTDADLKALFNEAREFSVSNGTCIDALSQIYEVWKNIGWTHTYENGKEVITIGRTSLRDSSNTSDAFAYGVGKGLTSIKKAALNAEEFATRLYVYGSDRNIQTRYYNGLNIHNKESVDIRNLMIPPEKWGRTKGLPDARKAFLQADDSIIEKYGLIPRTVYFDGTDNEEIYPSITGLTEADVRRYMLDAGLSDSSFLPDNSTKRIDKCRMAYLPIDEGDKESVEAHPTWKMGVHGLGFNVFEQGKLAANGEAVISMKSGACAGREFTVKSSIFKVDGQELTLERVWDESIGMGYPNNIYKIMPGDQFVILDIPMPEFYITAAQDRLYEAAQNLLNDYTKVSAFYEPAVDSIKVKEGGKLLREGMYMEVYDEDIITTADHKDYVLIDTLTIDEKGELPKYQVTLREQKRASRTFGTLEEMIDDTKRDTAEKIDRQRQYTDRRFRSAQETIEMLKGAFSNFSDGITPVSVQTMSLLVGDEGLQYKFTASRSSLDDVPCPLSYDNATKQFKAVEAALIHMTLGIDSVTTSRARVASEYLSWMMPEWNSSQFEEASKRYYVYARVPKNGTIGSYVFSESVISLEEETDYYHLLIGILNSEFDNARDFITLYGFTEVLPGQITTDVIRDGSNNLIIDLINATITAKNGAKIIGDVQFGTGSTGLANLEEWQSLQSEVGSLGVSIEQVQDQIDGVVENWNGFGTPTFGNEPAVNWITNAEKIAHINDTYINIEEYVDDETTPTAGQAWRWCQCGESEEVGTQTVIINGPLTQGEWVKVGQLDMSYNYNHVVSPNGKIELAYDQEIMILSGPPTYIKVDRSGAIYLLDNYSYFVGANSITLLFEYADYTIAYDKDGNLIKLHWHPIADSDAVRALKEAAEATRIAESASRSNLIADSSELIYTYAGSETSVYGRKYLPITVNAREQYTFKCELAENLSDDGVNTFIIGLAGTNRGSGWISNYKTVEFGKNIVVTFTINDGIQNVKADLCFYKSNAPRSAKARFSNFSLVKGTTPMSTWEDYQGDNGLQNLINIWTDEVNILGSSTTTAQYLNYKFAELYVKPNETYTFKVDKSRILAGSDTGFNIGIFNEANQQWLSKGVYYVKFGEHVYATMAIKADVANNTKGALLIYAGQQQTTAGKQIEITRPSLVKGTRPMMVWKENTDYLTNAFKNGTTKISGGLTMAQAVMVEDGNGNVKGMLNGSDYGNDTTHGKLILAAGSKGASAANMRDANTKIYEDGTIEVDNPSINGKVIIDDYGFRYVGKDTNGNEYDKMALGHHCSGASIAAYAPKADFLYCVSTAILAVGDETTEAAVFDGDVRFFNGKVDMEQSDLYITDSYHSGISNGLRMKARTVSSGTTLDPDDHHVFIASGALRLPKLAKIGQVCRIYHISKTQLTISPSISTHKIMALQGSSGAVQLTNLVSTMAEIIELTYSGSAWLATKQRYE